MEIEVINGKLNRLDQKYVDGTIRIDNGEFKREYSFPFSDAKCVNQGVYDLYVNFKINLVCDSSIIEFNEDIDLLKNHLLYNLFKNPIKKPRDLARLVDDANKFDLDIIYHSPKKDFPRDVMLEIKNRHSFKDISMRIKSKD